MQDDPFPSLATIKAQNIIESALGDAQLLILDNLSALALSSNDTEAEDGSRSKLGCSIFVAAVSPRYSCTMPDMPDGPAELRAARICSISWIDFRRPKDYVANEGLRF